MLGYNQARGLLKIVPPFIPQSTHYKKKINMKRFVKTLQILESDTEKIVEYVENTFNKDKKKYKFWELIIDNDK